MMYAQESNAAIRRADRKAKETQKEQNFAQKNRYRTWQPTSRLYRL